MAGNFIQKVNYCLLRICTMAFSTFDNAFKNFNDVINKLGVVK